MFTLIDRSTGKIHHAQTVASGVRTMFGCNAVVVGETTRHGIATIHTVAGPVLPYLNSRRVLGQVTAYDRPVR